MPRIDIELTSASPDGSWTWRAAGARQPRGVLDGTILPAGAAVGQQLRVEAEYEMEGITVQSVVAPKEKAARGDLLEMIPVERSFEPVIQQRARPERDERLPSDGRGDRPRGDRPPRQRRDRPDRDRPGGRSPGGTDGGQPGGAVGGDRDRRGDRRRGGDEQGGERHDRRTHRPHFTPPPEIPQRPKPKRLRPGKQHRSEVLASLPDEQRPIAELAVQGMSAVRQRLKEDNARLRAEGKPEMPPASVLKLAEDLLPRIRVAEWLDRAEAAQRQLDGLDLRDLRSVVAASDDPAVGRDESTRALATSLKEALTTKQEQEQQLWLADVDAALGVGRVIRALRLSSQPPKAGVPFPGALAERLGAAATDSLQPADGPDRWAAVLEAAAFSPVRALVKPTAAPTQVTDELRGTVTRLGPLLPQIAVLFGIDVPDRAATPKPLRPPTRRRDAESKSAGRGPRRASDPAPASTGPPPPTDPPPPPVIPPPPARADPDEPPSDSVATEAAPSTDAPT